MAKRFRPPTPAVPEGALPPGVAPIPLSWLVHVHERPRREDQLRDRLWLDLRREIDLLFMDTDLDLRRLMVAEGSQRDALEARRLAQLERHFAADPRVTLDMTNTSHRD